MTNEATREWEAFKSGESRDMKLNDFHHCLMAGETGLDEAGWFARLAEKLRDLDDRRRAEEYERTRRSR